MSSICIFITNISNQQLKLTHNYKDKNEIPNDRCNIFKVKKQIKLYIEKNSINFYVIKKEEILMITICYNLELVGN